MIAIYGYDIILLCCSVGPINLDDLDTYRCVADRSGVTKTATIQLSVEGPAPPDYAVIKPPQANVPAGSDLQFECLAIGECQNDCRPFSDK